MNQYGYVSVNTIIAKVYRDLNLQLEARIADFMEWVAEAIEYIDATVQYIDKKTKTEDLKDYRYYLPCDLVEIKQVLINGSVVHFSNHTVLPTLSSNDKSNYQYNTNSNTYNRQDNCLILSTKRGKLQVFYLGLATDENGFPLIVNNIRYLDAVQAYIVSKIKYSELMSGRINPNEYEYYKQNWEQAKNKAASYISFPTPDNAISIGKQFQRLIPNINSSDSMFKDYATLERSK